MALIGGAAIIAILAASMVSSLIFTADIITKVNSIIALAGVILVNDPAPIDSRQFNNKNFVVAGFSPLGSSTSPTETVTEPISSVQFVPNSLEGKIRITNVEYLEEYNDHQSPIYKTITREIENDIKESLKDTSLNVKVLNLT